MVKLFDFVPISPGVFDIIWSRTPVSETNVTNRCVTTRGQSTYCLADGEKGKKYFTDRFGQRLTGPFALNGPLSFFATDTDRDGKDEIYVKGFWSDGTKAAYVFEEAVKTSRVSELPDMGWIKIPYDWGPNSWDWWNDNGCFGNDWFSRNEKLYISVKSGQIYISAEMDPEPKHFLFIVNDRWWLVRSNPNNKPYRFLDHAEQDSWNHPPPHVYDAILSCGVMAAGDARTRQNLRRIAAAWRSSAPSKIDRAEGPYHFPVSLTYNYSSRDIDVSIGPSENNAQGEAITELSVSIDPYWGRKQTYYLNRAGLIYRRVDKEVSVGEGGGVRMHYFDMTPLTYAERSRAIGIFRKMEVAQPDNTNIRTVRIIFENYVVPGWAEE